MATVYTWADAAHSSVMAVRDGGLPSFITASVDNGDYQALVASGVPIGAYNAPPAPIPMVTGRQINGQMTAGGFSGGVVAWLLKVGQMDGSGKATGAKPDDWNYWKGIALDTGVPVDNPKVGRILVGGGVVNPDGASAVPAFMQAALQLPA